MMLPLSSPLLASLLRAGKTTLLDVLAGRKNSGTMEGGVYLNGHPKDPRTFNRVAAYCEQQVCPCVFYGIGLRSTVKLKTKRCAHIVR
jgi:ABC-type uncharacterized transport system ATPase subunit